MGLPEGDCAACWPLLVLLVLLILRILLILLILLILGPDVFCVYTDFMKTLLLQLSSLPRRAKQLVLLTADLAVLPGLACSGWPMPFVWTTLLRM